MISTRLVELVIDTVVCLTLAKWETVSGQFGGYLRVGIRSQTSKILSSVHYRSVTLGASDARACAGRDCVCAHQHIVHRPTACAGSIRYWVRPHAVYRVPLVMLRVFAACRSAVSPLG